MPVVGESVGEQRQEGHLARLSGDPSADRLHDVLTPEELAEWLRVEDRWVEKANQARRLPGAFKVGRYWRYERAAIEKQRLTTGQVLLPKGKK